MTTMTSSGRVPEFTLGWRMRLALESGDMTVQQMAETLGYSRSSVSRWLNDVDPPRAAVTAQWALLTGVDRAWLENGEVPTGGGPTPPGGPKKDKLAALTDQKRGRTRTTRPGVSTDGYLVAA